MAQQGRLRRSSLELQSGPVATSCYADTIPGPFSASFDQDPLSLLLAASARNGFSGSQQQQLSAAAAPLPSKAPGQFLGPAAAANGGAAGLDPSLYLECEEPGPLPCLPRGRALGSGGPYNSSASALMAQPQGGMQQGAASGRQGRPRRHSVTIGMLNEHQQQQQAAAYAAALAAATGGVLPGTTSGLGMMGSALQQPQQLGAAASPNKQQLQALSGAQALAAAAQLGMGASSILSSLQLALQQQQQQQQEQQQHLQPALAASSTGMRVGDMPDFGAQQLNMAAPRMPNAGGCRRHSWAPTGVGGSNAYTQALLLHQQQQLAAAALGDPRGLLGLNGVNGMNSLNGVSGMNGLNGVNGMNGVHGMNGLNGMNGLGKPKGLAAGPRPPAGSYANGVNGSPYLNGSAAPGGSGPPSGSFAGLSSAAAAAAAALQAQVNGLAGAGGLAGLETIDEQQLMGQLLQLQQQAGLAAGAPVLPPYMEAAPLLDAGQGLGQPAPAAVLPGLAPVAGAAAALPAVAAGLLPGAGVGATTHLTQLGLDVDGLSSAAAAASMYAPLQINGVTLDSQLLVAPFADNWDVMCAQGPAGITPQQLAAFAAGLNAPQGTAAAAAGGPGFGVMSPRATPVAVAAPSHSSKHHKSLPARSGSCGSNSSNGSSHSNGNGSSSHSAGANGHLSSTPLSNGKSNGSLAASSSNGGSAAVGTAAALAAASMVPAVPAVANVCSDAPWDLKKAAEEDAKVLADQQERVEKLMAALEHSQTLAKVRAAQAACSTGAAAADAAAEQGGAASERVQPVLFGYQLPDTGADAWGGSSSSAVIENTPGGGCISQEPSNKLFVGNIGWWVTEEDLLHWFSRFGTVVHVKIMYNSRKMHKPKDKWRSREYGFIDYATPEEAARAIVWMDGVELPDLMKDTCGIIVQYAKPTGGNGSGNGACDSGSGVNGSAANGTTL